jgi:creatinine amidohydrolase
MTAAAIPACRARYLPAMSLKQIAALPDKAWAPVLINTGAIEQHGPHLPVAVDALIGQALIDMAIARLPADVNCYVAPPVTIGKSNEHTGYPGTLTLTKETLRALLLAAGKQVHAWGFRSLAVINTHGGNLAVIGYTLRELTQKYGLRAEMLSSNVQLDVAPRNRVFGYHAEETETSFLLALAGRHVKMERATTEWSGDLGDPGEMRAERAPATFAWVTRDLSRYGVMGDARAGTLEKGRRWLPRSTQGLADALAKLARELKAAA